MATHELYVFAHLPERQERPEGFVPAGLLTLTESHEGLLASKFAYGTRYLDRPFAIEVDPVSLSLADKAQMRHKEAVPINGLPLFGGIRDAAPDAWGRRVIEAKFKVPANSLPESTYLLEAGSDRVGALDVRPSLQAEASRGVAGVQSLQYLQEAAERIELGESLPSRLTDLFGSSPGAGGARPKATVRDAAGLMWLAKFASRSDTFDVAWAEHATLRLAQACGMTVPETRVTELGGKSCLLIRRFDRYWVSDTQLAAGPTQLPVALPLHTTVPSQELRHELRLPFASALTMVACDEMASRTKGYADIAAAVRRHAHPAVIRQNTKELFMRMVFNIFVSNDDDHLRNHGFVRDPRLGGWRLSPLYDVVPRPGVAYERYLHLEVGLQGKLATLDNALSAYARFDLERPDAVRLIAQMAHQVQHWRAFFEEQGACGALIDKLVPAMRSLEEVASVDLRQELRQAHGDDKFGVEGALGARQVLSAK
jgi:serine/threonine-protein kinase HipA